MLHENHDNMHGQCKQGLVVAFSFSFLGGGIQTKMSWRSLLTSQYSR